MKFTTKFVVAALLGVGAIAPLGVARATSSPSPEGGQCEPAEGTRHYYTDQDEPLVVPPPGVRDNHTGCPQSWNLDVKTTTEHGALTLHADGSFEYIPDRGYTGPDKFVYMYVNEGGTNVRNDTVRITVLGLCDTVAIDDEYETQQGQPLYARDDRVPKANDSHCGHGYRKLSDPEHGTVFWRVDSSFDYTPDPGFAGVDTFEYELYRLDESESDTATVTITVGGPPPPPPCEPVAVNDAYETPQGVMLNVVASEGVLANDTHCDGIAGLSYPPEHGMLVMPNDGSIQYTPDTGFTGVDTFGYNLIVGGGGPTATVTITVTDPPPPPQCVPEPADDAYETPQDVTLEVGPPGVLDNDTPCSWDNVAVVNDPAHGTLVSNFDGTFQYTPDTGFTGVDAFDYVLVHAGGSRGLRTGDRDDHRHRIAV